MNYVPPFSITDEMLNITIAVSEKLGQLTNVNGLDNLPRLRRVNRLMSIQSSLAIENNTLSLRQVTDVINGKLVVGPQDDITAVQNAFEAYGKLDETDAFSLADLLSVHTVMMKGLVTNAGKLRTGGVGVFDSTGKIVHIAPPPEMVRQLLTQLFDWVKTSQTNMLIRSCVFHYEFEFIHPFADGNGRMGRLWQTALLTRWNPLFKWIPVESIIKDNQQEYYQAIRQSTSIGNSNPFILFMLKVIYQAICRIQADADSHLARANGNLLRLLDAMETYPMSAAEIMARLNMKSVNSFRKNYLTPALQAGLIAMTVPDKPTSRNQRYYKL